jgi:hypothetical protein
VLIPQRVPNGTPTGSGLVDKERVGPLSARFATLATVAARIGPATVDGYSQRDKAIESPRVEARVVGHE